MAEVSTIVSLVKEYLQKPDESSLEAWTSYCTSKQTLKAKAKQTLCLVVGFVKLPRSNTPMVNSFTCFHLFYFINSLLRMCGCVQNIIDWHLSKSSFGIVKPVGAQRLYISKTCMDFFNINSRHITSGASGTAQKLKTKKLVVWDINF